MRYPHLPALLLPFSAVLGVTVLGCSHTLRVDVPRDYTGTVSIFCEQFSTEVRSIQVEHDGAALKAVCPRSRTSLSVMRNGHRIQPDGDPQWSVTGDGIVLAIQFNVH